MRNKRNTHSPGPWRIDEREFRWEVFDRDDLPVVTVYKDGGSKPIICDDEVAANARLVGAAPDLLAACKLTLSALASPKKIEKIQKILEAAPPNLLAMCELVLSGMPSPKKIQKIQIILILMSAIRQAEASPYPRVSLHHFHHVAATCLEDLEGGWTIS